LTFLSTRHYTAYIILKEGIFKKQLCAVATQASEIKGEKKKLFFHISISRLNINNNVITFSHFPTARLHFGVYVFIGRIKERKEKFKCSDMGTLFFNYICLSRHHTHEIYRSVFAYLIG
jgi:hypothetical protein